MLYSSPLSSVLSFTTKNVLFESYTDIDDAENSDPRDLQKTRPQALAGRGSWVMAFGREMGYQNGDF
jgi:hypothetical protein